MGGGHGKEGLLYIVPEFVCLVKVRLVVDLILIKT